MKIEHAVMVFVLSVALSSVVYMFGYQKCLMTHIVEKMQ